MNQVNIQHIDFLTLLRIFQKEWESHLKKYSEADQNNLSLEESKLLYYTDFLFKNLNLLTFKDSISPEELRKDAHTPYICKGGTCALGECPSIGRIVHCDGGCMYSA